LNIRRISSFIRFPDLINGRQGVRIRIADEGTASILISIYDMGRPSFCRRRMGSPKRAAESYAVCCFFLDIEEDKAILSSKELALQTQLAMRNFYAVSKMVGDP
jgi:hypothetical protein